MVVCFPQQYRRAMEKQLSLSCADIALFSPCRVDSASVTSRELIRLQNVPVKTYDNTLDIFKLENFPKVSTTLTHSTLSVTMYL